MSDSAGLSCRCQELCYQLSWCCPKHGERFHAHREEVPPTRHVTIPPACASSSVHIMIAPRPGEQVVIEPGAPCAHHAELAELKACVIALQDAEEGSDEELALWKRAGALARQP